MRMPLILFLLFAQVPSALCQDDSENLESSRARAILCLALERLHTSKGTNVWPGYDPLESPLIVKFQDGIYGFGEPKYFRGWAKSNDSCTSYQAPAGFQTPSSPISPYVPFGRVQAFYFDLTVKEKISAWLLSAVIHERFHRFQFENFKALYPLYGKSYSSHASAVNVGIVSLENSRLGDFTNQKKEKSMLEFLGLSVVREDLMSEESKQWELSEQISEGTAYYVQWKAMKEIEDIYALDFEKSWKEKVLGNLSEEMGVDGVIKWRHYSLGGLICRFLDEHAPNSNWKEEIQNTQSLPLYRRILPLVSFSENQLKFIGHKIVQSAQGQDAIKAASSLMSNYSAEIEDMRKRLISNSFVISILRPRGNCSGGGASERTYYLAEGGTLKKAYSGSYTCSTQYQEVHQQTAVIEESRSGTSRFGTSKNLTMVIDGHPIDIGKENKYQFKNFKFRGSGFEIEAASEGEVTIKGTKLDILFR